MRRPSGSVVAIVATLACVSAQAASFSSSATFNSSYISSLTAVSNPSNGGIAGHYYPNVGKVNAGITSAAMTADTIADTGNLTAMGVSAVSVTSSTVQQSYSASLQFVVADFPNPPTIQTIAGTWQESITISGISGPAPSFTPAATPGLMGPDIGNLPWYSFYQEGILATSGSFFLTGAYKVIGPLTTTSVPINLELQPIGSFASVAVKGSTSFGNGFAFAPTGVGLGYKVVNPTIFEGEVDHLRLRVEFADLNGTIFFRNSPIPEPSSCVLSAMAGAVLLGTYCRRR